MPLFEFACRLCGRRFETFVTATRQPKCPQCESTELEKQFSTFATRASTSGGVPHRDRERCRPAVPPRRRPNTPPSSHPAF